MQVAAILAQFPQESWLNDHYIYARVSTDKQSPAAQLLELLGFCKARNLPVPQRNIAYEEDTSGKITWEQRAIGRMARAIPEGSTIIVPEFSRVGRSMADVQKLMGLLHERRIALLDAKSGERFDGGRDSMLKTTFLAYFADLEHEMISQRTRAGLVAAVARGKKLGRPAGKLGRSKLDPHADLIRERLAEGRGTREIAEELAGLIGAPVSWSRVADYAKERGLRPETEEAAP
jgi:DNA invertase Pin-like site-specific DNA recombinase